MDAWKMSIFPWNCFRRSSAPVPTSSRNMHNRNVSGISLQDIRPLSVADVDAFIAQANPTSSLSTTSQEDGNDHSETLNSHVDGEGALSVNVPTTAQAPGVAASSAVVPAKVARLQRFYNEWKQRCVPPEYLELMPPIRRKNVTSIVKGDYGVYSTDEHRVSIAYQKEKNEMDTVAHESAHALSQIRYEHLKTAPDYEELLTDAILEDITEGSVYHQLPIERERFTEFVTKPFIPQEFRGELKAHLKELFMGRYTGVDYELTPEEENSLTALLASPSGRTFTEYFPNDDDASTALIQYVNALAFRKCLMGRLQQGSPSSLSGSLRQIPLMPELKEKAKIALKEQISGNYNQLIKKLTEKHPDAYIRYAFINEDEFNARRVGCEFAQSVLKKRLEALKDSANSMTYVTPCLQQKIHNLEHYFHKLQANEGMLDLIEKYLGLLKKLELVPPIRQAENFPTPSPVIDSEQASQEQARVIREYYTKTAASLSAIDNTESEYPDAIELNPRGAATESARLTRDLQEVLRQIKTMRNSCTSIMKSETDYFAHLAS